MKNDSLSQAYERDRNVWNDCAETYEQEVVGGHPNVVAYEAFEEDFLDRVLLHLIRDRKAPVHLFDVGCGSARLHLRYGLQGAGTRVPADSIDLVAAARGRSPAYRFEPHIESGLSRLGGIDFSAEMIRLAREKMVHAGLGYLLDETLYFREGSAFDLNALEGPGLPVAVSLCNSIGVMQGPLGAIELFKSMRRAVEPAGGIAVISSYRADAIRSYALGNYESTMNVCGQPRWLEPDTYAGTNYLLVPRAYKHAYDADDCIVVDVYDRAGNLIQEGHTLTRNPDAVAKMCRDGHIRTYTDYESNWYSYDLFAQWIQTHWSSADTYHMAGKSLDPLRAEPVQLAILDAGGHLRELLERWTT